MTRGWHSFREEAEEAQAEGAEVAAEVVLAEAMEAMRLGQMPVEVRATPQA
jgi:hypothetical protein